MFEGILSYPTLTWPSSSASRVLGMRRYCSLRPAPAVSLGSTAASMPVNTTRSGAFTVRLLLSGNSSAQFTFQMAFRKIPSALLQYLILK